ncbi:MAG: aa3-type cytochrome c oxidase subunit IV [Alphaproteobacteria bacterium]|nr:aa3-type cytochrome c oxidase subunit IV [Alphaproteobacteria bacterium]
MASHDTPEYGTADGNDYAAHESMYEGFLLMVGVGIAYVVNIAIALAIGGTKGAWLTAAGIIVVATVVAAFGLIANAQKPGYVLVVLSLLALAVV